MHCAYFISSLIHSFGACYMQDTVLGARGRPLLRVTLLLTSDSPEAGLLDAGAVGHGGAFSTAVQWPRQCDCIRGCGRQKHENVVSHTRKSSGRWNRGSGPKSIAAPEPGVTLGGIAGPSSVDTSLKGRKWGWRGSEQTGRYRQSLQHLPWHGAATMCIWET